MYVIPYLFVIELFEGVKIMQDRPFEQHRLLRYDGEAGAELMQADLADVTTVEDEATLRGLEHTEHA